MGVLIRGLTLALVMVWATRALAQSGPAVQAVAGVGFGTATDGVYAGAASVPVSRRLRAFGELGQMRDAVSDDLNTDLEAQAAAIRSAVDATFGTSVAVEHDAHVRASYGMAGLRADLSANGRWTPYLEIGGGMARLEPDISLRIAGDRIDPALLRLDSVPEEHSEFLAAAGAGVAFLPFAHIRVEGGYRFTRIFGDDPTNLNRVHAAIGFVF
ncbi:MAG: outer membrane beta-barrel protein [Acidobacteria bacterium]|nr:outer membrane beta-barrel protein [Acidobacteriota bacterium]